jgi:hypothetical protein
LAVSALSLSMMDEEYEAEHAALRAEIETLRHEHQRLASVSQLTPEYQAHNERVISLLLRLDAHIARLKKRSQES